MISESRTISCITLKRYIPSKAYHICDGLRRPSPDIQHGVIRIIGARPRKKAIVVLLGQQIYAKPTYSAITYLQNEKKCLGEWYPAQKSGVRHPHKAVCHETLVYVSECQAKRSTEKELNEAAKAPTNFQKGK